MTPDARAAALRQEIEQALTDQTLVNENELACLDSRNCTGCGRERGLIAQQRRLQIMTALDLVLLRHLPAPAVAERLTRADAERRLTDSNLWESLQPQGMDDPGGWVPMRTVLLRVLFDEPESAPPAQGWEDSVAAVLAGNTAYVPATRLDGDRLVEIDEPAPPVPEPPRCGTCRHWCQGEYEGESMRSAYVANQKWSASCAKRDEFAAMIDIETRGDATSRVDAINTPAQFGCTLHESLPAPPDAPRGGDR